MSRSFCPWCNHSNITTDGLNHYCNDCGYEWQSKQPLFDQITQSYETLAEKLVYKTAVEGRKTVCDIYGNGVGVRSYIDYVWKSSVTGDDIYTSEEEAIAATVAKLKEVAE